MILVTTRSVVTSDCFSDYVPAWSIETIRELLTWGENFLSTKTPVTSGDG